MMSFSGQLRAIRVAVAPAIIGSADAFAITGS